MRSRKHIEESRRRKRVLILKAAKDLFLKEGFDNVSMRGIASAAGYSPAALYRYFKNKREILSSLRNDGYVEYLERQGQAYNADVDPVERLARSGRNYVRFAAENPDDFHLMFCTSCEEVDLTEDMESHAGEGYAKFRASVAEVLKTGLFGDEDEETVAFAMWAVVHGLSHLNNSGRLSVMTGRDDTEELVDKVLRFAMRPVSKTS